MNTTLVMLGLFLAVLGNSFAGQERGGGEPYAAEFARIMRKFNTYLQDNRNVLTGVN